MWIRNNKFENIYPKFDKQKTIEGFSVHGAFCALEMQMKIINKHISKLRNSLANVNLQYENLKQIYKEFYKLKEDFENQFKNKSELQIGLIKTKKNKKIYLEIQNLIQKIGNLDAELCENANILLSEGRIKFLKLFLPSWITITIAYFSLNKEYFLNHPLYSIGIYILLIFVLTIFCRFFILREIDLHKI